eukprot:1158436-Pelagomonas_calceolata.AAC.2
MRPKIVGFFISLAAVMYSVLSAGTSGGDVFVYGVKSSEKLETDLPYRTDFFHIVFALASTYIAMLFSFWEVSPSLAEALNNEDASTCGHHLLAFPPL